MPKEVSGFIIAGVALDEINASTRSALARLNGTTHSAVALLSGMSEDELADVGGLPEGGPQPPELRAH